MILHSKCYIEVYINVIGIGVCVFQICTKGCIYTFILEYQCYSKICVDDIGSNIECIQNV